MRSPYTLNPKPKGFEDFSSSPKPYSKTYEFVSKKPKPINYKLYVPWSLTFKYGFGFRSLGFEDLDLGLMVLGLGIRVQDTRYAF